MNWVVRWNEAALGRALEGGQINTRDGQGATPLWHAAYFGRADWVARLLGAGADPRGHAAKIPKAVITTWEKLPADADRATPGPGSLLHVAAANVDGPEVAELLIAKGVAPDQRDHNGCTPLHVAAFSGTLEVARVLLRHGADPDAMDCAGFAPLDHAGRRVALVRALLEAGANPEGGSKVPMARPGWPPLTHAALWGWLEQINLLLGAGAALHRNAQALGLAAKEGRAACVARLVEAGADVDATIHWRSEDRPALEAAAMYAKVGALRELLPVCAHQRDRALRAVVALTVDDTPDPPNNRKAARLEAMALLLEAGADPSAGLMAAAATADEAYVRLLLKAGGDPGVAMEQGEGPHHVAASLGHHRVFKLLLAAGADALAPTPRGETPYQLAQRAYRDEGRHDARMILSALREAGAAPPEEHPPADEPAGMAVGGRIRHKKFGPGTVTAMEGEGEAAKLTITFDDPAAGQKILLARFVALAP